MRMQTLYLQRPERALRHGDHRELGPSFALAHAEAERVKVVRLGQSVTAGRRRSFPSAGPRRRPSAMAWAYPHVDVTNTLAAI
jgi:hypothetical protein